MKTKLFVGAAIITTALIYSCSGEVEKKIKQQKTLVKVTQAISQEVSFPIRTSGILSSKKEMKLSFKTGGIIDNIYCDEGQKVEKGQILACLKLSEIKAQVNLAKLGVEKAKRDLKRAENLYTDSVATLEQFQNAKTALDYASSQLQIAEFNRQYSLIEAPADGKILKRLAETSEMIAPGYPLFLFASSESDWVLRTSLADRAIVKIKPDDKAKIKFDAFPGEEFNSKVSEIATFSDPYTGTYEVELKVLNPNSEFVTGLIGAAHIIPTRKENYLTLPVKAIHEAEAERAFVFIAQDSGYRKKRISIVEITDSLIYFDGEIKPEVLIIIEGAEYLNPNSRIEIVE